MGACFHKALSENLALLMEARFNVVADLLVSERVLFLEIIVFSESLRLERRISGTVL